MPIEVIRSPLVTAPSSFIRLVQNRLSSPPKALQWPNGSAPLPPRASKETDGPVTTGIAMISYCTAARARAEHEEPWRHQLVGTVYSTKALDSLKLPRGYYSRQDEQKAVWLGWPRASGFDHAGVTPPTKSYDMSPCNECLPRPPCRRPKAIPTRSSSAVGAGSRPLPPVRHRRLFHLKA